jgi:hypothetical protein
MADEGQLPAGPTNFGDVPDVIPSASPPIHVAADLYIQLLDLSITRHEGMGRETSPL